MARFRTTLVVSMFCLTLGVPAVVADHEGSAPKLQGGLDFDEHHEPLPNPPIPVDVKAECSLGGSIDIDQGLEPDGIGAANHNHYSSTNLFMNCSDNPFDPHYEKVYELALDVGSDGCSRNSTPLCDEKDPGKVQPHSHGETLSQGWSHSSGFDCGDGNTDAQNTNKGDIFVDHLGSSQATVNDCADYLTQSWVKFAHGWDVGVVNLRSGDVYHLWGQLAWNDTAKKGTAPDGTAIPDCFSAHLRFVPTIIDLDKGNSGSPGSVIVPRIAVSGEIVIYNVFDYIDAKTLQAPAPDLDANPNQTCDFQKQVAATSSGSGASTTSRGPKS